MEAQLDWLESKSGPDSPDNRQSCLLAFWRPTVFSSGRHGHGYSVKYDASLMVDTTMKKALQAFMAWRLLGSSGTRPQL